MAAIAASRTRTLLCGITLHCVDDSGGDSFYGRLEKHLRLLSRALRYELRAGGRGL